MLTHVYRCNIISRCHALRSFVGVIQRPYSQNIRKVTDLFSAKRVSHLVIFVFGKDGEMCYSCCIVVSKTARTTKCPLRFSRHPSSSPTLSASAREWRRDIRAESRADRMWYDRRIIAALGMKWKSSPQIPTEPLLLSFGLSCVHVTYAKTGGIRGT